MNPRRAVRFRVSILLPVLAAVLAISCDGDSPSGPQTVNVAGTWDANISATNGSFHAAVTLSQSGSNVSGNWSAARQGGGTISGTVSGESFAFNITQGSPCPGSGNGSAGVVGRDSMNGSYSVSGACGFVSANFSARRR